MVVEVGLALFVFDVFEGGCLDVDLEVPALVVAEGNPVEAHFPAVEVAVDVDGGVGHAVVDEVVAGGDGYAPVGCEAEAAGEAEGLDDVVLEVILCGIVFADVAEGVVGREIPGEGEVGVGAHEECGVVVVGRLHDGGDNLFASGFLTCMATEVAFEGVVVDVEGDLGAPCRVIQLEEPVLGVPEESVVLAPEAVDLIGAEGAGVVEDDVFEEGGAATDGEVGPTEGVAGEVVAHGEVEAFEEGDFAGAGDGVLVVAHLDFEIVAYVEAQLARLAVGRTSIEALLEDGVTVDVAGVVGIGTPIAETLAAEIGTEVERDRGVDYVAQGTERTVTEVEHAVDAGREGGAKADIAVGTECPDGVDSGDGGSGIVAFADSRPVPALIVGERVGPVEIFEKLDGTAEGNGVLDAVLHAVEGALSEEVGILCGDVVVGRE